MRGFRWFRSRADCSVVDAKQKTKKKEIEHALGELKSALSRSLLLPLVGQLQRDKFSTRKVDSNMEA